MQHDSDNSEVKIKHGIRERKLSAQSAKRENRAGRLLGVIVDMFSVLSLLSLILNKEQDRDNRGTMGSENWNP